MHNLICIVCPRGCHLKVENGKVSGNFCKRGETYALKELTNPERMLTTTVEIESLDIKRLSVVTSKPIPKAKIFEVMAECSKIKVKAPINVGDVIIPNVLSLGVDVISSRNVEK